MHWLCRVSTAKIYLYHSTIIAKARPHSEECQTDSSVQKQSLLTWTNTYNVIEKYSWESIWLIWVHWRAKKSSNLCVMLKVSDFLILNIYLFRLIIMSQNLANYCTWRAKAISREIWVLMHEKLIFESWTSKDYVEKISCECKTIEKMWLQNQFDRIVYGIFLSKGQIISEWFFGL